MQSRQRLSVDEAVSVLNSVLREKGYAGVRVGKTLNFDPKMQIYDDKEANAFLGREYRKGYELPVI